MKWSKSEQSNVEEPVWPGSQLCAEGTAATEAVKAWNDGSSWEGSGIFSSSKGLWRVPEWFFRSQACSQECNSQLIAFAHAGNQEQCKSLRTFPAQCPASHSGTSSENWAESWKLHPKRGECRIVHIQTSQLKARLQVWVTESFCNVM